MLTSVIWQHTPSTALLEMSQDVHFDDRGKKLSYFYAITWDLFFNFALSKQGFKWLKRNRLFELHSLLEILPGTRIRGRGQIIIYRPTQSLIMILIASLYQTVPLSSVKQCIKKITNVAKTHSLTLGKKIHLFKSLSFIATLTHSSLQKGSKAFDMFINNLQIIS